MPGKDTGFRARASIDRALLDAFLHSLRDEIDVTSMVVFGSRAKGDNLEDSDYDILVISPDFERHDPIGRVQLLLDAWPGIFALEPVALTPSEFDQASGALIWDILHDGLLILDNGVFERKRLALQERIKAGDLVRGDGFWSFPQ